MSTTGASFQVRPTADGELARLSNKVHVIPEVRENPSWLRRDRDGEIVSGTPYGWTAMSLASNWREQIIWPTLKTAEALG